MNIKIFVSALILAGTFFCFREAAAAGDPVPTYSLQDLLVIPRRVVFEGAMRTAQLSLVNRGNRQLTYAISFVNYRMTDDGSVKEITKPEVDERFAEAYVRFTPRRVVLEPGQVQMLRMQLLKPSDLAEGEYRSHLAFRVIPAAQDAAQPDSAGRGISIRLIPIYGLSIPVIVRHGSLNATVRLTGLNLSSKGNPANSVLSLVIERDGGRSIFGDVEAVWNAHGSKPVVVSRINALAVYTPNAKRTLAMTLSPPKGLVMKGGELSVRFIEKRTDDTEFVAAETNLAIP